jgi:hypoxanthine phosphoribosyltransferase
MAAEMNEVLRDKDVIFIGILNGSFMFVSDLLRAIDFYAPVSFVKISSYEGTRKGKMKSLIGLTEDVTGKTVVLLEDIVDTGNTLEWFLPQVNALKPKQVLISTLLFKPEAYGRKADPDFVGFRIPNRFVIGYGLDYKGLARNLKDLYVLNE